MKKQHLWYLFVFMGIVSALILSNGPITEMKGQTYEDFTKKEILRFHIRAESDEEIDQEIKMEVKREVLAYLKTCLSENMTKAEVRKRIEKEKDEIHKRVRAVFLRYQKKGEACLYFTKEYFPIRQYGSKILPAGYYEACRIDLGRARGKNWWCILYPDFCSFDQVYNIEETDQKEELLFGDQKRNITYRSKIYEWFIKEKENIIEK